ncbi:MAG: hypothetical protein J6386_05115 [Candidatus Synoicihabitans palmerolidicus]|nr:hypothetical protein [Candidatus Synoicihabitans palmerolidicus]
MLAGLYPSLIPPTNPDLVDLTGLRSGDAAALRRVMDRWAARLHAFAWRYLQHTTDAHEVAMETFVRLHRAGPKLRPDTRLSSWLFTTAATASAGAAATPARAGKR